jgi:hypothetical protein
MTRNKLVVGIDAHARSFVRDPVTLVLAIVLPAIVIEGWGQAMSGLPDMPSVEVVSLDLARILGATLGVSFIAGLLGLVLIIGAREADRRLVLVGYSPTILLISRLVTIGGITAVIAGINLAVLAYFVPPEAPVLALAFLALAGVLYAFIGVLVGAALPRIFEGSLVVVLFAFMDAFLSGDSPLAADTPDWVALFPLYHPKRLVQDAVTSGSYDTGDLWVTLAYVGVLFVLAGLIFRREMGSSAVNPGGLRRFATVFTIGLREQARNYLLVGLLVALPILFITLAFAVTQDAQTPIQVIVDGETTTVLRDLPTVHGVVMTPITSTLIAGIIGLLLMHGARNGDGRLVLAGYRAREVIGARFSTLTLLAGLVTAVTVGVMVIDITPELLGWFTAGVFMVTLTYGLLGMLIGVVVGRLAGLWSILVASMLDIGLFQDPLFRVGEPAWWMEWLPGYHGMQVIMDAGLTAEMDSTAHLGWAVAYMAVLGLVTVTVFYRETRIR